MPRGLVVGAARHLRRATGRGRRRQEDLIIIPSRVSINPINPINQITSDLAWRPRCTHRTHTAIPSHSLSHSKQPNHIRIVVILDPRHRRHIDIHHTNSEGRAEGITGKGNLFAGGSSSSLLHLFSFLSLDNSLLSFPPFSTIEIEIDSKDNLVKSRRRAGHRIFASSIGS